MKRAMKRAVTKRAVAIIIGIALNPILGGCAAGWNVYPGQADTSDLYCGTVQGISVRVRLQSSAWISCPKALQAVTEELRAVPLEEHWTVIVGLAASCTAMESTPDVGVYGIPTGGVSQRAVWRSGCTWPTSHVIGVVGTSLATLHHEFGHASDAEHGLPNTRDRVGEWVSN